MTQGNPNIRPLRQSVGTDGTFIGRGVLAIAFAVAVFATVAAAPGDAVRAFAAFSIVDGLLALVSGYYAHTRRSPRRTALFAEGFVECGIGIFLLSGNHDVEVVAIAIAANALIGGALGSVSSYNDPSRTRANWLALYGILGILLGFAVPALFAVGFSALLVAVAVVVAIQGVARILLRTASN
jgi:uncharacterized membrane protein HdeD (DUF308 family)